MVEKKKTQKWEMNWELKRVNKDELFEITKDVIGNQLDEVDKTALSLETNLSADLDADSVDVVAILLALEERFKEGSETKRTVMPTDKLSEIKYVADLVTVMYEVLLEIEKKNN
jgi:acyl carrier protein